MKTLLIILIRAYRYAINPMLGPTCRYYPSCSQYCQVALERHGFLRGVKLSVCRLCRCNPWSGGGHDPVP